MRGGCEVRIQDSTAAGRDLYGNCVISELRWILGLSCAAGVSWVEAAIFGPVVQWSAKPESAASVRWLESADARGVWTKGRAGFGYGDVDDRTLIDGMEGRFDRIFVRTRLKVPAGIPDGAKWLLRAKYDDAVVVFAGGREIARLNARVVDGREQVIRKHEAENWEEIELPGALDDGAVVAAVGLNDGLQSSDFSLDLAVVARWEGGERVVVEEGAEWEYLTGAEPEPGWKRETGAGRKKLPELAFGYREKGTRDWRRVKVRRTALGQSSLKVAAAELSGLPAGTDIEIRLGDEIRSFRTAPKTAESLRFVTGGDLYHTLPLLDAMNLRAGSEDPVFALLGGDLAYSNNENPERWCDLLESWDRNARTPDGRMVPMVVAIGNHEVVGAGYRPHDAPGPEDADEFFSLFKMQEPGQARQVIDFAAGFSLVLLDSGHAANLASQTAWLEKTLRARSGVRGMFVCYHRPAWGCGAKEDAVDIQKMWCPLFDRYRVDGVFENDHHVYSRSKPLRAGEVDEKEGIPYLGAGAWGVNVREIPADVLKTRPWLARAEAKNHLFTVDLDQHGWTAVAKEADGKEFDRVERKWRR